MIKKIFITSSRGFANLRIGEVLFEDDEYGFAVGIIPSGTFFEAYSSLNIESIIEDEVESTVCTYEYDYYFIISKDFEAMVYQRSENSELYHDTLFIFKADKIFEWETI